MNSPSTCEPTRLEPEVRVTLVDAQCERHGAYRAKQIPGLFGHPPITMYCPKCVEEREAQRAREDAERAKHEERARREAEERRRLELFQRSGVPVRFQDRTLDNYVVDSDAQRKALAIARRLVDGITGDAAGASAIFCGRPGTGKTHLACGIARELTSRLRSALFLTVLAAVRHVKDTYRRDSERSESDAIADLIKPDLLILDEVGVQLGTETELRILFEVLNERYAACRSTILISNLTADELGSYLGERVMDRFRECGAVVAFDWASHRGARRAA